MVPDREDGFPARDRVGAHDGVHGLQVGAGVVRRAARGRVEVEGGFFGGFAEGGLGVGCGEGFEEGLVGAREAVEELVA